VFLGFFDKPEGTAYWVPLIDEHGPLAAAAELARREPARLFWNGLGTAAWVAFSGISLVGLVLLMRGPHRRVAISLSLMVIVLSAVTFTSHAVRWSQRSPMEFALAIFFAQGLAALVTWLTSHPLAARLRGAAQVGAEPPAWQGQARDGPR